MHDEATGGIDDRLRRRVLWAMPTGLYVVGSRNGPRRNLMTANLAVQVATEPKLVAVAIDSGSLTRRLIDGSGCWSLSMLDRADRAVVRRFVKAVPETAVELDAEGRAVAMAGEPVAEHVTGAPVLERAVAWLDLVVRHSLPFDSHALVVGEVVGVGGPHEGVPEVLRMEDTRMNYGG